MYQDKTISCKDCGTDFVFTVGEQQFYAEKGFDNEPKKCKSCRENSKKRNQQPRSNYARGFNSRG